MNTVIHIYSNQIIFPTLVNIHTPNTNHYYKLLLLFRNILVNYRVENIDYTSIKMKQQQTLLIYLLKNIDKQSTNQIYYGQRDILEM